MVCLIMKTFGGEQSLLGGGGPAGLYADKSVKWLQLVIEVREVVITKNTTSTYALLGYLYINCTSQEIPYSRKYWR